MLLSAWTEYDGTLFFGGSLLYTKRQTESIFHTSVPTRSRDLGSRIGVKSNGAMDVHEYVSQIHPLAERYKKLLLSIFFRRGRWPDKMCLGLRCWGDDVPFAVILQPTILVDPIESDIVRVGNKEFNKEATVLETGRMERHGVIECYTHKTPFDEVWISVVCNQEQPANALDDASDKHTNGRNVRGNLCRL